VLVWSAIAYDLSPGGARDFSPGCESGESHVVEQSSPGGATESIQCLSPLRGLFACRFPITHLTMWAKISRPSGAEIASSLSIANGCSGSLLRSTFFALSPFFICAAHAPIRSVLKSLSRFAAQQSLRSMRSPCRSQPRCSFAG